MGYKWKGRIYVDQWTISPEEYKTFFAIGVYRITLKEVNSILAWNKVRDYSRVVPITELNEKTINAICNYIREKRLMDGVVVEAGEALRWRWNPVLTKDDGRPADFEEMDIDSLNCILSQMIDDGCHWGNVK